MHPILGQLRRLALYLFAWVPLACILTYLLASLGRLGWTRAVALAVPLCAVYAFICLSAWYSCRGTPLQTSSFSRLALAHLAAAVVAACIWLVIARGFAIGLAYLSAFEGLDQQIAKDYPLLFGSGVLLYLLAVALHYVLLSTEASHEAEKRESEARLLARDSELKALKTQVNPHFIFNCLNSISALTTSDPAKAREMCILLADFLRRTLGLGLIENAVAHGIANLTDGGWIRLYISQGAPESLSIKIENNFDPEAPRRRGAGIGLKNVRQRLNTSYGDRARFEVQTNGDRFSVALSFPAETQV